MLRRARKARRVRGTSPPGHVPRGMTDTISGCAENSIYCDIYRQMLFVRWDNRQKGGFFKGELEALDA